MTRLKDNVWEKDDILEMCGDAELKQLDPYAQGFIDDMRRNVIKWGATMFLSGRQENYLIGLADAGLREQRRHRGRK